MFRTWRDVAVFPGRAALWRLAGGIAWVKVNQSSRLGKKGRNLFTFGLDIVSIRRLVGVSCAFKR